MKLSLSIFEKDQPPAPVSTPVAYKTGRSIRSPRVMPEHAQQLRSINSKMMRMYDAALSNNLNADFPTSTSSANAEIFTSLMPTRSRARTLDRDNPFAWAILESMRRNVGGHEPFRLEMKAGTTSAGGEFIEDLAVNQEIEAAWAEAGLPKNCTTSGDISRLELYLQAITAMVRDGGIIGRHWDAFPHNKFRYAIQPLEYDRLDHYWNGRNEQNGNDIRMSVEVERPWDRKVAYWLLTKHPGDFFVIGSLEQGYRERIPAEKLIMLFDLRMRAEQVTAVSRLSSIIQRLHRKDQFDLAHVTAAIWASCKPFFITQEFPTAMDYVPDFIKKAIATSMEEGSGQEGDKQESVEPGSGHLLGYGQKPILMDPKFPIEAAEGFSKDQLRAAAAGSGTAYHDIANDLEGVNFSSGRLGNQAQQDGSKILQEHFVFGYAQPHFNQWLRNYLLFSNTSIPISRYEELCLAAKFHGRRWPYVNPLQDVQADILAVDAGLSSRDHVIQNSERGGDVERVNAEISAGKASDEAHGLNFDSEPGDKGYGEHEGSRGGNFNSKDQTSRSKPVASKKGGKQTIKSGATTPTARALRKMRLFRELVREFDE
jgi:lambda family phage portal protein